MTAAPCSPGENLPGAPWSPAVPWTIQHADCRAGLRALPPGSLQTIVTSIPYWGLRAYGTAPQIWGGDPACPHVWTPAPTGPRTVGGPHPYGSSDGGVGRGPTPDAARGHGPARRAKPQNNGLHGHIPLACFPQATGTRCEACGAWQGELGQEPTPDLFVAHIVEVFRAAWPALRPDGTLWLNIGDTYSRDGKWGGRSSNKNRDSRVIGYSRAPATSGLGHGQLLLIPARVALALQADGWILRAEIVWLKRAPMPESVADRPTTATERIYLFSKARRYYYDKVAIMAYGPGDHPRAPTAAYQAPGQAPQSGLRTQGTGPGARNAWNYWLLGPEPQKADHYAAFPTEIPRRAIAAATSAYGACATCGAPWRRRIRKEFVPQPDVSATRGRKGAPGQKPMAPENGWQHAPRGTTRLHTVGWEPTCTCHGAFAWTLPPGAWSALGAILRLCLLPRPAALGLLALLVGRAHQRTYWPQIPLDQHPVRPCVVGDPFSGTGTTVLVARQLGRHGWGSDLLSKYVALSIQRIHEDQPLLNPAPPAAPDGRGQLALFGGEDHP